MIIGIAGAKRAGKNTVAKFIAEEFGNEYEVCEWSFAEDLKRSAAEALGETSDHIQFCEALKEHGTIAVYMDDTKVSEISGREYLQFYGTEAHRDIFDTDFWVNNTLNKICRIEQNISLEDWKNRIDLITDVRFPNEAEEIRDLGGKILKVRRDEVEQSGDTHASEKPLPDELIDRTILNNGTLEELKHNTGIAIDLVLRGIV